MRRARDGLRRPAAGRLAIAAAFAFAALAWTAASSEPASHLKGLSRLLDDAANAHPNALWRVVHGLCVRDMKVSGLPAPCVAVDLDGGYAIVKDYETPTQYLLVPTARLAGIESPALQAPDSPNYWQAAWTARRLIEKQVGQPIPRDAIGLAINSVYARTQRQLHIHIDCVRADVRAALKARRAEIGARWAVLGTRLAGRTYRARWVAGADLGANDPFKMLAESDPATRAAMARQSLIVIGAVGADGGPGFVLLSDRADPPNREMGDGERLLDHHCGLLSKPAPGR